MTKNPPTYIGSEEACRILGNIDRSTLSRWVSVGRLQVAMRVGSTDNAAFLFSLDDVKRLAVERAS